MFITYYKANKPNTTNISYADLATTTIPETPTKYYKVTQKTDKITTHASLNHINAIHDAFNILEPFIHTHTQHYRVFQIPKRSGGLRTIHAPNPEFKEALSKVKNIFEQRLKCLPHDAAYAYVKNRSVKDALIKHQNNNSNWYLKIDLKDFFPSCTPGLIFDALYELHPFCTLPKPDLVKLKTIIDVCCLNNGLPQGTPMSPILTNLLMVRYDYAIYNYLKRGTGEHYVYTRYADDILISSKSKFDWKKLQDELAMILAPFQIKKEKTRFGSKNGSNWNLGLMLNKDNNITLGSEKKRTIKAMLNNYLRDIKNNIEWSKEDRDQLQGHLSYLKNIEPNYYDYILQKYQNKYNVLLKF